MRFGENESGSGFAANLDCGVGYADGRSTDAHKACVSKVTNTLSGLVPGGLKRVDELQWTWFGVFRMCKQNGCEEQGGFSALDGS